MLELKDISTRPSTPAPSTKSTPCDGVRPDPGGRRFRHRHRRQRRRQIHHAQRRRRRLARGRGQHHHRRRGRHPPAGAQAGQVHRPGVPGPHDGHRRHHAASRKIWPWPTAGAQRRTLRSGITQAGAGEVSASMLKTLGLGLEDRMTSKVGLLSGGQRQALTLLMATLQQAQACSCWTSTPPPWTPRQPPRCSRLTDRDRRPATT